MNVRKREMFSISDTAIIAIRNIISLVLFIIDFVVVKGTPELQQND